MHYLVRLQGTLQEASMLFGNIWLQHFKYKADFCSLSRALLTRSILGSLCSWFLISVNCQVRVSGSVKVSIVCTIVSLSKKKAPNLVLLREKKWCWGLTLCFHQADNFIFPFVLYFEHLWSENLRSQMLWCSWWRVKDSLRESVCPLPCKS